MGFFRFKKKPDVIDLGERYRKQQERAEQLKEDLSQDSATETGMAFLGNIADTISSSDSSSESQNEYADLSSAPEDRKKRLAKRLMDMTEKIEELNNQIYHLQQRIELLEKKLNVSR